VLTSSSTGDGAANYFSSSSLICLLCCLHANQLNHHHWTLHCCDGIMAEELSLSPHDHSSYSSSLSSFSCMQDTSSDEKEFTGLIIGGANAALLLQVSHGSIMLSCWPLTSVSKRYLVQGMLP
jgi:hypothetical protein